MVVGTISAGEPNNNKPFITSATPTTVDTLLHDTTNVATVIFLTTTTVVVTAPITTGAAISATPTSEDITTEEPTAPRDTPQSKRKQDSNDDSYEPTKDVTPKRTSRPTR
ncbi:hypothetical protein L6452_02503 [Arctium lappa]|uniref:Uncharacterized protein n=1 Tax=Arctium lappa TaxID=4217 RepID=A0ACB9FKV3_ARCLA|nr:hypothetical protein L6452_02503 [Arctium lappa]